MIPKTSWPEQKESMTSPISPEAANSTMPIRHLPHNRVRVTGKYLWAEGQKYNVRGVTYGPFRPDENGCEYHTPDQVDQDFRRMAKAGFNSVRTYTVPPRWLLDIALNYGLRVMIGLPWEQHVTFLDRHRQRQGIDRRIREGVSSCKQHPAVLCFVVGNEIPGPIVRWYGRKRIENWIERLYKAAKSEDPDSLVTYVNFPTTEYLELPFLDFFAFNVYLESENDLRRYLARLQNRAGNRPLLMAEVGLDSMRNGEEAQAQALKWQIGAAFSEGCCGTFIFSWTDEWFRGGCEIEDWGFGLTDRHRQPKLALEWVTRAYKNIPLPRNIDWPRVSVVVCTYNGSSTIRETCSHLITLDYPDYEVIVVDDGSTEKIAPLLISFPQVRIIRQDNAGLSAARNTGLAVATGDIVAYIDDDAYPDSQWLKFLAWTFQRTEHVGIGGPNLPPLKDHWVAQCVARSPGIPNHVLLDDQHAEHIPGCNMAFRRSALEEIGGFDTRFRIAGDDVDVCWRLQQQGGTLGYHSLALVWHHPRKSVKGYLRQQYNYGRAEGMLENKWPHKYNGFGYAHWKGHIYGANGASPLFQRWRVYHGIWGTAPFQGLYTQPMGLLSQLPLMPDFYVLVAVLAALSAAGALWTPLLAALPILVLAVSIPMAHAWVCARRAIPSRIPRNDRWKRKMLVAWMHLAQPAIRLKGRLSYGLGPWRLGFPRFAFPITRKRRIWSENWIALEHRLESLEEILKCGRVNVERGGIFDRWDLNVSASPLGGTRILMAMEEHGSGQQLVWFHLRPYMGRFIPGVAGLFALLTLVASVSGEPGAMWALAPVAGILAIFSALGCGFTMAHCLRAVKKLREEEVPKE